MKYDNSGAAKNLVAEGQDEIKELVAETEGFEKLAALLKEYTGINLPTNSKNISLMANRMRKVLKSSQVVSYKEFLRILESGDSRGRHDFVTALTTNTTHFFRENSHFEFLQQNLPAMISRKRKLASPELRIWCAAASTGPEVYSIMITLLEALGSTFLSYPIKFLATDIDVKVLKKAAAGIYNKKEMEGVPSFFMQKYFEKIPNATEVTYRVLPILQSGIRFAPFNLMTEKYPFKNHFDIIFCRNVLIYFDSKTSLEVVGRLVDRLEVGGLLFLGHAEFGTMKAPKLNILGHSIFEKRQA
ncbi:MAG: protein-glutamate O-methyltransferase CheR [Pseudomonadota bacterium]|nr:protein-glutamate O-methyltransferase CheR [Pseudomonadota bacterium]